MKNPYFWGFFSQSISSCSRLEQKQHKRTKKKRKRKEKEKKKMGGETSRFDKEKFPPRNATFKRHSPVFTRPRQEWGEWCDSLGFDYHTDPDGHPYWFDDTVVFFTSKQIEQLQEATHELHHLCLQVVEKIIDDDEAIMKLGIPKYGIPLVKWSWKRKNIDQQSLYGRFDLMFEGTTDPILLEYNADTPTTLIESALVQRKWLELAHPSTQFRSFLRSFSNRSLEFVNWERKENREKKEEKGGNEKKGEQGKNEEKREKEEEIEKEEMEKGEGEEEERRSAMHPFLPQCNVIELRLVEQWGKIGLNKEIPIHFTCMRDTIEDLQTITYMATCAQQAGFSTLILYVDEIGYDEEKNVFIDQYSQQIQVLWKLYPWECIWDDEFGPHLVEAILSHKIRVMEPAWKALLSTKAILPFLFSFFPDHPLIVPSGWRLGGEEFKGCERVIAKPMHGREGENMRIIDVGGGGDGKVLFERDGVYEDNKTVYQKALHPVTFPNGRFVVVGGWTVGDECAGVSVREDEIPITTNYSFFLPHFIRG